MSTLFALNQADVSQSGIVAVYLVGIVFSVLALLVFVISVGKPLGALIKQAFGRIKEKLKKPKEAPPVPVSAPVTIEEGITEEEVAVIMATISALLTQESGKKAQFVVKKLHRV